MMLYHNRCTFVNVFVKKEDECGEINSIHDIVESNCLLNKEIWLAIFFNKQSIYLQYQ